MVFSKCTEMHIAPNAAHSGTAHLLHSCSAEAKQPACSETVESKLCALNVDNQYLRYYLSLWDCSVQYCLRVCVCVCV